MGRRKKIIAVTDNSGWKESKTRKPRKPMSEEQRQAAAERLVKAREKRAEKNPDYGMTGFHESLRNLPEEHPAHPKKIKKWIKTQKELVSEERKNVRNKVKGALAKQSSHEGYIRHLLKYLRDGDYIDMFFGEHQESKVTRRCITIAYDKDGTPKRDVDVWYPDMGCVYTQEMYNEDKGILNELPPKTRKKRKRSKGAMA